MKYKFLKKYAIVAISNILIITTVLADSLEDAVNSSNRSEKNIVRDQYRHPLETLRFFGLTPEMHVAEIWPTPGWYAEILAPYLRENGKYYAIGFSLTAKRTPKWRKQYMRALLDKFAEKPDIYDKVAVGALAVPEDINIAPAGSLDMILTFRNTHNWIRGDYADAVFEHMYTALKPGGILGLVQHRADQHKSIEDIKKTGYISEDFVIELAGKAGFILVEKSNINANSKDTKDHPKGVWTLPPSLRLGDENKPYYLAIGESDRMTLKFQKPLTDK